MSDQSKELVLSDRQPRIRESAMLSSEWMNIQCKYKQFVDLKMNYWKFHKFWPKIVFSN